MESIYSWAKRSKCRNEGVLQENLTKKYCTDCPVKGLCNTYAIVHNEVGIWGGTSETDRRKLDSVFVDLLTQEYRKEGLLENRSIDPLEFLGHEVALRLVQTYPNAQPDLYQDPTLSQSA